MVQEDFLCNKFTIFHCILKPYSYLLELSVCINRYMHLEKAYGDYEEFIMLSSTMFS